MKDTSLARSYHHRVVGAACVTAALAFAIGPRAGAAQPLVDPDPELFDGTRTKTEQIQQEKSTIDDWEGPNIIVYDSNEKGSEKGGAGRSGMEGPGMDIGDGTGMGGLPIPVMGGAGGTSSKTGMPSMPNPQGGSPAPSGEDPLSPEALGVQAAVKPGDVAIGDNSQKIANATPNAGSPDAPSEPGETGNQPPGEDSTKMEKSAAVKQSGTRGGGVEKGDAMPPDI